MCPFQICFKENILTCCFSDYPKFNQVFLIILVDSHHDYIKILVFRNIIFVEVDDIFFIKDTINQNLYALNLLDDDSQIELLLIYLHFYLLDLFLELLVELCEVKVFKQVLSRGCWLWQNDIVLLFDFLLNLFPCFFIIIVP